MAGVCKKPNVGGNYHGWFIDVSGNQRFFTGTRSKTKTLRMAERFEDEHRQVRLGYRPAPHSSNKYKKSPFSELREEYLAWGESQGGRGGRPWGETHARCRRSQLKWWQERVGLEFMVDLDGILPRVEKALREMQAKERSGKTWQTMLNHLRLSVIGAKPVGT